MFESDIDIPNVNLRSRNEVFRSRNSKVTARTDRERCGQTHNHATWVVRRDIVLPCHRRPWFVSMIGGQRQTTDLPRTCRSADVEDCPVRAIHSLHTSYNAIILCTLQSAFITDHSVINTYFSRRSVSTKQPSISVFLPWSINSHSVRPVRHYVGSPVPAFRPPMAPAFRTHVYDCRPVSANA